MTMTARGIRRFQKLPDIVGGSPLPHFVGIIVPVARTNLVTNPSIETATTGYTAVGGSIAQSNTRQYHGLYSLGITPTAGTTDGAFYGTVSLTSGTTYVLSCKFWGVPGVKYKISFATTGGVDLAVKAFVGTGRWQWVWVTYTETSSTTRRLYFTKNTHTSTGVFYIDGVQVEACGSEGVFPTTYIDGDQVGLLPGQQPTPYQWTGTPHASTSTRSALTRAGGRVMDIKTAYGFLLTGIVGLGMAVPNNVSIPYTVLDGARWQRTTYPPRTFAIAGRFQGNSTAQLDRLRSDFRAVLSRDLTPVPQPMVMMLEPRDDCGDPSGDFIAIQCVYAGGLEGNDTSALAEDVAPTFTMYVPLLLGGDAGAPLTVQTSVSNANDILRRSPTGTWSAMGTGATGGQVQSIVVGLDQKVYAGGLFTSMGGVANTNKIAYWDPADSAWHAMGTGALDNNVQSLAVAPNGDIIAGGAFTQMGGVANTARIARWNGSAWSALGTGVTTALSTVYAVIVDSANNVYATGDFTAPATRIAKWNGSAWSGLGTGLNDLGDVMVFSKSGALYVGGDFTTANGVSASKIAVWNGTTFAALGAGFNLSVIGLAFDAGNRLYATGVFTNAGYPSMAKWNGAAWTQVDGGLNNSAYGILAGQNGLIYVGGIFTASGSITFPDGFAIYNGSVFTPNDVNLPATSTVRTIAQARDGTLYIGYNQTGTATSAAVTAVTNPSPVVVYPRLVIKGPSSGTSAIYQIKNYTSGLALYLNYTINAGETAVFTSDGTNVSFTSDFQGDLTSKILPGSNVASLYLAPGANSVSFFAISSSVTATFSWRNQYNGLADLVN